MRYDAFISYRHSELDMDIAKKIHSGLEGFKVPVSVQKKSGKKNIKRVFRDQEELPIGSDLDNNISAALKESEYLIVICSPRTPESYWVCKEIETFIEMHDRQHILAVLVEGEPNEAFPPMLLEDEDGNPVEPLAADVRGETPAERKKKLKTELLRLAAPLLSCSYDDLRQRHRERKIRQMTTLACSVAAVVAALGIGFAIYNAKMAAEIEKNYNLAVENYELAEKNYNQAITNQYRYMADKSLSLFDNGYREDAVLVGLESLADKDSEDGRPYVPQAEYAISKALYTYDTGNDLGMDAQLSHKLPVYSTYFDSDGCHLITIDQSGRVYIWDYNENKLILEINPANNSDGYLGSLLEVEHIGDEYIIGCSNYIAAYSEDGSELWAEEVYPCSKEIIDSVKGIVICESVERIEVFDLATHKIIATYTPVTEGDAFTGDIAFDSDNSMIYVGCGRLESDSIKVNFIDLDTGATKECSFKGDTISTLSYYDDKDIVVKTFYYEDAYKTFGTEYVSHLMRVDYETGNVLWDVDIDELAGEFGNSAASELKIRQYTSDDGSECRETILTEDNNVFCINSDTGEQISRLTLASAVRASGISKSGGLAYIALASGNIEVANLSTGIIYSDYAIKTGIIISDMHITNGVMVLRAYESPDVLLMKYHTGKNMTTMDKASGTIADFYESSDGKYIAARVNDDDDAGIDFFEKDGSRLGYFSMMEHGYANPQKCAFLDSGRLFVVDTEGNAITIDPLTLSDEKIEINVQSIFDMHNSYITSDNKYAVLYSLDEIAAIDLSNCKVLGDWYMKADNITDAIITADGSRLYYITANDGLGCINMSDSSINNIDTADIPIICHGAYNNIIAVSNDGSLLAISCQDGFVRIVDSSNMAVKREIAFSGLIRAYMRFSSDDSKLVLQGDDYYIHIYDVSSGEKLYSSDGQYYSIDEICDNQNGTFSIGTTNGVIVFDSSEMIPIAYVDRGKMYTSDNKVLIANTSGGYIFPFQTIQSLREDAKDQFGNATLSEEKRVKYHIN